MKVASKMAPACLLAIQGDEIVEMAGFRCKENCKPQQEAEIVKMFVSSSVRNQGIATRNKTSTISPRVLRGAAK